MRASYAIVAAGLLLACGCSVLQDKEGNIPGTPQTRYKVLSFFFDGVPPPGATSANEDVSKLKKREGLDTAGTYKEHGPYAAKLCNACHDSGSNALILPIEELCLSCHSQVLGKGKQKLHGPVAAGGCRICHNPHGSQYPYYLIDESKKFCYYCHNEEDVLKREVHRQTSEQCTFCHSAHSSTNACLLKE